MGILPSYYLHHMRQVVDEEGSQARGGRKLGDIVQIRVPLKVVRKGEVKFPVLML